MEQDSHDKLRARAYAIWEAEGRPSGREQEHWDQARREILSSPVTEAPTPKATRSPKEPVSGEQKPKKSSPVRGPRRTPRLEQSRPKG
jgi:hypothetical protein